MSQTETTPSSPGSNSGSDSGSDSGSTPGATRGVAHVGEPATLGRVLRDQRKILWIGLFFMVAAFWVCGPLGKWTLGASIAVGVALALANHLATELWLLRLITSGREPSRAQMTGATLTRLAVLAVVAVGLAVLLWPDGVGLLLGLAIFRLISLMMTSMTLLKELKSQS